MDGSDIGRRLWATALHEVDWRFGDSQAQLVFGDSVTRTVICLVGIHCLMITRSNQAACYEAFGRECHVHFADVVADSAFAKRFLEDELGTSSRITHYDSERRPLGAAGFVAPKLLCVVCSTCNIDVLCDEISVE